MNKKLFLMIPAVLIALIGCTTHKAESSEEQIESSEASSEPERPTESITLTFTADQFSKGYLKKDKSDAPVAYTWTDGNAIILNDKGSQYSFTNPETYFPTWRFYVGTYLFLRITTGTFKEVVFTTYQYNPFQGSEVVTGGTLKVDSDTKATITAQENKKEIKIHNSNKGDTGSKKQVRFTSVTFTWYK